MELKQIEQETQKAVNEVLAQANSRWVTCLLLDVRRVK